VRVRRTGVLAVLALILAAPVAASVDAQANARAKLLRAYAPVLVLHPDERFHPETVDGYLADADLVGNHYDQRLCRSIDGPAALDCYTAADAAHVAPATSYSASFESAGRVVLEYWLFYPFDLYSVANPPNEFWQDHEADWEAVAVVLDTTGTSPRPLLVAMSRHCSGARRGWARVERRGTHPVVYVALGSHAGYYGAGEIPLERKCWPPAARAIFTAYAVPLRDHVAAGRELTPAVVPVTAASPTWMAFAGRWGETQYVHFPRNAPFAYGLGPSGPAFHGLWKRPLQTVLGWPPG
jgi:hypothetical protein